MFKRCSSPWQTTSDSGSPSDAAVVGGILRLPGQSLHLIIDLDTFDPIDPGLRQAFGRNGRRRVENLFSWKAIAHRTLDLYRSLMP